MARPVPGASFFLATPGHCLLTRGRYATLADSRSDLADLTAAPEGLSGRLRSAMAGAGDNAIVVGAIPFDTGAPPWLFIPTLMETTPTLHQPAPVAPAARMPSCTALSAVPDGPAYEQRVAAAVKHIQSGALRKVVLARALEVELAAPPDRHALLAALARGNRYGYTFALDLPAPSAATSLSPATRTLFGASPELLIRKEGDRILANPLAGSTARDADPARDRERADALQHSAKDRHEHAVVVDAIVAVLAPLCNELHYPDVPELTVTDALWHLSTPIEGRLADATTSSLALGLALHPTPAICGTPTAAAQAMIASLETEPRGLFTGMVGWCDAAGDGEWIITIRCAEQVGNRIRLHAGAGIVAQSDPAAERAETATKFATMLRGLGIESIPELL